MNDNAAPSFSASENGLTINEPIEPEKREAIEPQKTKKSGKGLVIKLAATLAVLGIVAFAATQIDYVAVVDNITATGYEPSPEMSALINDLSLTSDGMRILNATRPELQEAEQFNANCSNNNDASNTSTLGCYSGRRIYIYNIARVDLDGIRQVTLAHEFLHAVWERMSDSERETLQEHLQALFDTNEDLRKHLESYRLDEKYNELHSVIGSQISPNQMPAQLRDHYAKYFSNHSKIASFYNKYHSVFEETEKREKELKEQITERREKLNELRDAYTKSNASLSRDINDFNSRSRTGAFSSQEEWLAERQALLNRQEAQQQDYQTLLDYTNEINDLISQYNENSIRVNNLYKSIDSNVSRPDGAVE